MDKGGHAIAGLIVVVIGMRLVVLNRYYNHLALAYPVLGNDLFREKTYLLVFPFERRHIQTTIMYGMR